MSWIVFVVAYFIVGYVLTRLAMRKEYKATRGAGWGRGDTFMACFIWSVWPVTLPVLFVILSDKCENDGSLGRKFWGIK